MAKPPPNDQIAEEDFIDMDFAASPPRPAEFEFLSVPATSPSPADDLFYRGKLLPIHLPPRLQMLMELIEKSTPYVSCSASPSPSCSVSEEQLNPEEEEDDDDDGYFLDFSGGDALVPSSPMKPWATRITHKLKSLLLGGSKAGRDSARAMEAEVKCERGKSHSNSASVQQASSPSSSSASGVKSSESREQRILRMSSNGSSDAESSIEGAIAYCKRSQLQASPEKKTVSSNSGFCLISASKIVPH